MKLYTFTLLLSVLQTKRVDATFCGCASCTQEVWDTLAIDSNGSYTCGERIDWLKNGGDFDEASACAHVSDEFFDGPCGPVCNPTTCNTPPPEPVDTDQMCNCASCTEDVLNSIANGSTCRDRINWVERYGFSEEYACEFVGAEYPSICGMCHTGNCALSPPTPPTNPTTPNSSGDQKCGGAVDSSRDINQACQDYLWGPTGDRSMHCFGYGGVSDTCHLNNNNDWFDGIYKDPSFCFGDTFYLWDEPDTQRHDYTWAGTTWLDYSKRYAEEIQIMKSRGTKVTGPLLKAGDAGVLNENMITFFNACGDACLDPNDPAYIDVVAINGFCGPWNGDAGCRGGAKFIYEQAVSVSSASNNLPVYITNWSRLETSDPSDQLDAINSIDEFFPASSVVKRVYWFGARDYGGGAATTGYLTNVLSDERTLGEVWRAKCDDINSMSLVESEGVGEDVPGEPILAYY